MNTMIDRWNRIKVSAEGEAQSHYDELRASRCEGQAHTIKIAIDEFVDACTPRAPRAEWFERWDSWYVNDGRIIRGGHWKFQPGCECCTGSYMICSTGVGKNLKTDIIPIDDDFAVLPVAREGFPAPVGWKVVEA